MRLVKTLCLATLMAAALAAAACSGGLTPQAAATASAAAQPADRAEVERRAAEYMRYYETITLTREQEGIKTAALEAIPAPCCSDFTAATCCCPCNLSKTIWGLSNHLIANEGADVVRVRAEAERWIQDVNPGGFSGDVCYTAGGCARPFHENGCGGMGV
jgi:hypothetical protein